MGVAIVLFFIAAALLLLILARYAEHPALSRQRADARQARRRLQKPRFDAQRLQDIALELTRHMGLVTRASEPLERPGSLRLDAIGKGALRDAHHIVYIEPHPIGERVGPETVLQLAEDVRASGAQVGILITPFLIDRSATAGLDVDLELIDGLALRDLVAEHLPQLTAELDDHHLTGTTTVQEDTYPFPTTQPT